MWVCFSPVLLTLLRTPRGRREFVVSLIGWLLPTRSNRPAAAAQVRRMKQATVDVKSPTSIVYGQSTTYYIRTYLKIAEQYYNDPQIHTDMRVHT